MQASPSSSMPTNWGKNIFLYGAGFVHRGGFCHVETGKGQNKKVLPRRWKHFILTVTTEKAEFETKKVFQAGQENCNKWLGCKTFNFIYFTPEITAMNQP